MYIVLAEVSAHQAFEELFVKEVTKASAFYEAKLVELKFELVALLLGTNVPGPLLHSGCVGPLGSWSDLSSSFSSSSSSSSFSFSSSSSSSSSSFSSSFPRSHPPWLPPTPPFRPAAHLKLGLVDHHVLAAHDFFDPGSTIGILSHNNRGINVVLRLGPKATT